MARSDLLADGEILCELEEVVQDGKRGALVVTDLRLLLVRTTVILRRTKVVSLADVQAVEAVEDTIWESRRTPQVFGSLRVYWMREMPENYDRELMKRGEAARRLIGDGEDPFRMLLQAVWPDHDWDESVMLARLMACPRCSGAVSGCAECGSTGLVTEERRKLLTFEALGKLAYDGG